MAAGLVERHVQDADEEHLPLDPDGFLDAGAVDLRPALELAGHSGNFAILAAGGVGKSVVLQDLYRLEDGCWVDIVGLRGTEIEREIGTAVATGGPIYLDSLDEALAAEPNLYRFLNRAMSAQGADGVRWRLACRPSAWTAALTSAMKFEKFRLLPITRDAARHLLAAHGIGDGFWDELAKAGRSRLSASLLHFIAAARQWQQRGRLPRQDADVLESEIQRLLAEREDLRQPLRTGSDLRRQAAGRLASFAAFGGNGRFVFRAGLGQDAITMSDLPTVPEPDRPDATIEPEVYQDVLGSALFDVAPRDTVAFRHQEYADYLAAKYVLDREAARTQVTALLGLTDGVLPRAMATIAAWMVALRPELADFVAPANATTLIESEVDLPSHARTVVVDALLTDARAHHLRPLWQLDLSAVVHPGLESQLADRLPAGIESPFEAWWICRLALAGKVASVAPHALQMALDSSLPSWTRRPAIAVVTVLGVEHQRSALLRGLSIDQTADPDDELRAALLDGLYPQHMPTTQLLTLLKRPQVHFIGAYHKFLNDFASRIPAADLPDVVVWALENLRSQISVEAQRQAGELAVTIAIHAFSTSNEPAVTEPLARLVVALVGHSRVRRAWAEDTPRRRNLARIAAVQLDGSQWYRLLQLGLVNADDIEWLTKEKENDGTPGYEIMARCLSRLTAPPEPEEELTDIPWAREEPDPAALRAAIEASRHDLEAWADIPSILCHDEDLEPLFDCDLTGRPGWALLSDSEQQEVLSRGLKYVAERSPHPQLWLGKAQIEQAAVRDWSGVYLLTTLARLSPQHLNELSQATWAQWAPAIVNAWAQRNAQLLRDLADAAPPAAKAEILAALRNRLHMSPEWRVTPLIEYFAAELQGDLVAALWERRYLDDQNAEILAFLIKTNPDAAMTLAQSEAGYSGSQLSRVANKYLAGADSNGTIDRLADALRDQASLDLVVECLDGLDLNAVDDNRLTTLARLLLSRFKLANDSPPKSGWSFDSPDQRGSWVRNNTFATMATRGLAAELRLLADGQPTLEQSFIHYHLRQARQVASDNAHVLLTPNELLRILAHSDIRLIRNTADLICVLESQFDELQHLISRQGGFRDLWSRDRKQLGSEDDITDWVRRWLNERLGRNRVILARESQIERLSVQGSGTRIDLAVDAPTNTAPSRFAGVIIEAKLFSNSKLDTALREQLVGQYLESTGQRHGIYLVYWVHPDQRDSHQRRIHADKAQLLNEMRRWAASVAPQHEVTVYVLDVSWPKR